MVSGHYTAAGRVCTSRNRGRAFVFADHLGSTNVSYRSDGGNTVVQRWYPWGSVRPGPNNALPTGYTFTGQLDSGLGLMYYGARYYDGLMVLLAVILAVGLAFILASLYTAHRKVEMYLLVRGATDVTVQHELFDFDRDTATFSVCYTGISGNRRRTRCKIRHVFLLLDDVIYWSDPLDMDLRHIEQPDTSWKSSRPAPMHASRPEERE